MFIVSKQVYGKIMSPLDWKHIEFSIPFYCPKIQFLFSYWAKISENKEETFSFFFSYLCEKVIQIKLLQFLIYPKMDYF